MTNGPQLMEIQQKLSQMPVADPVAHYASRLILSSHPEQAGCDCLK
jgi:MoxR-like ATPase